MRVNLTFIICYCLVLLVVAENWDQIINDGKWVSSTEPNSHFKYMGRTAKTNGYAHLVFNIDLDLMDTDMRELCQGIHDTYRQNNLSLYLREQYRVLTERCKLQAEDFIRMRTLWTTNLHDVKGTIEEDDAEEWMSASATPGKQMDNRNRYVTELPMQDSTMQYYYGTPYSHHRVITHESNLDHLRTKRQVIIGLIALVVSFASAIYSAIELASISQEADDATVVDHLHSDEINIAAHDRDIAILNATVQEYADELKMVRNFTSALYVFDKLVQVTDLTFEKWNRVVSGLEMLTLTKISPRLVNIIAMSKAVNRVGEKIKPMGYELDITTTDDIYKFPVSYLAFKNSTIRVFIHVPIRQIGVPMDIYMYVKTPIQLSNQTFLFPDVEEKYIVADNTMTTFVTLTEDEYLKCTVNKGIDGCPKGDILFTRQRDDCLMSLYQGRTSDIAHSCRFHFNPTNTHIAPIGSNTYLIYFPQKSQLELRCSDRQWTQQFEGGKTVKVPPGCTVRGSDFIVYGRIDIIEEDSVLLKRMVDLPGLLSVSGMDDKELEKAVQDLKIVGSREGITIEKIKLHQSASWWSALTKTIVSALVVVVAIIILIVVCICFKDIMIAKWNRVYQLPRVHFWRNRGGADRVVIAGEDHPLNNERPPVVDHLEDISDPISPRGSARGSIIFPQLANNPDYHHVSSAAMSAHNLYGHLDK